jgi:hypothetical protein
VLAIVVAVAEALSELRRVSSGMFSWGPRLPAEIWTGVDKFITLSKGEFADRDPETCKGMEKDTGPAELTRLSTVA